MIQFHHRGDLSKTTAFLSKAKSFKARKILEKYANAGLEALKDATPIRTGLTSESWGYNLYQKGGYYKVVWYNTHIKDEVLIAMILQYGHGTPNGRIVEGVDYINPALFAIFNKISEEAWKEITNG